MYAAKSKFLSTPSARRATDTATASSRPLSISIHALREEGDPFNYEGKLRDFLISIHALREEGDAESAERETVDEEISIHALREEGDLV